MWKTAVTSHWQAADVNRFNTCLTFEEIYRTHGGAGKRGGVLSKRKPEKSKNEVFILGTPSFQFGVFGWNANQWDRKTDP